MLLRPAQPSDADDVAGVHVRSWQVGYDGLLPDGYLRGLRAEDRAARYTFGSAESEAPATLVAVEEGRISGFATTAPARDADAAGQGELCALYVDPSRWGTGVGRALIAASRDRLATAGFADAILWVLAGNERAERFYRIDGWQPDGSRRVARVWGVEVEELRYRRQLT